MNMLKREINPDLIKNVQKYIDWMPDGLAHEVSYEIIKDNYSATQALGGKFEPRNLYESLAFVIAAMARRPTNSSPTDQTEWVKNIINDLRITSQEPHSPLTVKKQRQDLNIAEFLVNHTWSQWNAGYCRGWNGKMWDSLLDGVGRNMSSGVDFFKRAEKRGLDYGVALPEIIFSERQSNFNFLNWVKNPLKVKQ